MFRLGDRIYNVFCSVPHLANQCLEMHSPELEKHFVPECLCPHGISNVYMLSFLEPFWIPLHTFNGSYWLRKGLKRHSGSECSQHVFYEGKWTYRPNRRRVTTSSARAKRPQRRPSANGGSEHMCFTRVNSVRGDSVAEWRG